MAGSNPPRKLLHLQRWCGLLLTAGLLVGCGEDDGSALVRLHNDFDNPELDRQPLWTICDSSYLEVEFGKVLRSDLSDEQEVGAGMDYVLMVGAWDDPACAVEHCLPLASKNEEEVLSGQTRTIALNLPNHQGPCPPEGIAPMPEELYERIRQRWPDYSFLPYAQRTEHPQCQP
jgi:hypothetical protein